jgi:hypothetical protein
MDSPTPNPDLILAMIEHWPGISDRELAGMVFGIGTNSSAINPLCRELANAGLVKRKLRPDALLGNWLADQGAMHD